MLVGIVDRVLAEKVGEFLKTRHDAWKRPPIRRSLDSGFEPKRTFTENDLSRTCHRQVAQTFGRLNPDKDKRIVPACRTGSRVAGQKLEGTIELVKHRGLPSSICPEEADLLQRLARLGVGEGQVTIAELPILAQDESLDNGDFEHGKPSIRQLASSLNLDCIGEKHDWLKSSPRVEISIRRKPERFPVNLLENKAQSHSFESSGREILRLPKKS